GPQFLLTDSSTWPDDSPPVKELPERRRSALVLSQEMDISHSSKFENSFERMQRLFRYIYRFLQRVSKDRVRHKGELTVEEIKGGTHLLIKGIQRVHFAEDHKALTLKMKLSPRIKLLCMILPKSHHITSAIIDIFHRKFLHAGAQSFQTVRSCVRCFKCKHRLMSQIMGNLPTDRRRALRPFAICVVDFCGPVYTTLKIRGRPHKSYVALFVCFAFKAVHLEIVSDLSTDSFLLALQRF
ncbi:hypothetical protein KR059_004941, partial [Drosophila kikkawai]